MEDSEQAYMDYLDELATIPTGHSFGWLLREADPVAFQVGLSEWEREQ